MITERMDTAGTLPDVTVADAAPPRGGLGLRGALAAAGVLVFFTSLDLYASMAWGLPVPAVWVYAFALAAAVIAGVQSQCLGRLARSPLLLWALGFLCVITIGGVFMEDLPELRAELVNRYRAVGLLVALAILFEDPAARRAALLTLAGSVLLACALNVADALQLVKFVEFGERVPGRASGLYSNPNESGMFIVLGVALCASAVPRAARVPLLVAAGIGVVLTFSRGAGIAFAVLVVLLVVTRVIKVGRIMGVSLVVLALAVAGSEEVSHRLDSAGVLNENTLTRLRFQSNESSEERLEVARKAWRMFIDSPLTGQGFGSTLEWNARERSHNQYLDLGAEYGIAGLLLFPALALVLIISTRAAVPFSVLLLLFGFFSHNLLTDRPTLVLFALAGAVAAERRLPAPVDPAAEA